MWLPPALALLLAAPSVGMAKPWLPPDALDLVLAAPIARWDEAVPLGNGLLGGLLWGEGDTLRLSLDRGDLWDLRPAPVTQQPEWTWATMQRLVAEGDQAEIGRLFDDPYNEAAPSKIPAGRLEITLPPGATVTGFRLHLATAEGVADLSTGIPAQCLYQADKPVALLFLPGGLPQGFRLLPPASVQALGYPEATLGEADGMKWYVQETATKGQRTVGLAGAAPVDGGTLFAVTVTSTLDGKDPLKLAQSRVREALAKGYLAALEPHAHWWAEFWGRSHVEVPEEEILAHYVFVQYLLGSASRLGCPPIPLQGVWTADEGGLPPWKGDYHHDLNTQMTYASYLTAGHFEEGRAFLEFLWKLRPRFQRFAKQFYGTEGLAVPGVMALDGGPLGGWGQYSLSPTNGAWLAWMFFEHWRVTGDRGFLKDRAYPWCEQTARCLLGLLTADEAGVLRLPLSSSPEIHDNSAKAWLTPNSSYDQACMKALFLALTDMAGALGRKDDHARWLGLAQQLGPWQVDEAGCLLFAAGEPVRESHRHFSHSMAIHPFGLLSPDGSAPERATIAATCARYDELGTGAWCGYSFSWMSCLRARVGDGEAAVRNLELFVKAFTLRNGFHANGDQTSGGYSGFTYRPFTLEGNFLAAQAVQEMLLQSWSPHPGACEPDVVRLFPAVPWRWRDAAFTDLRAGGGLRVSARRQANATTWFRIVAERDTEVRLRDNFGGRLPRWSRTGAKKVGEDWVFTLEAGEEMQGWLRAPYTAAPEPANAARPLEVPPRRP